MSVHGGGYMSHSKHRMVRRHYGWVNLTGTARRVNAEAEARVALLQRQRGPMVGDIRELFAHHLTVEEARAR